AETIREKGLFSEVKTAFWHGEPALSQVLSTVTADEAYIVPIFKSEGHFTTVILPREMNLTGRVTERSDPVGPRRVHLCQAVGTHPYVPDLVHNLAKTTAVAKLFEPKDTDLLVIGHGGKASRGSELATNRVAEVLRERKSFKSVGALFLEQPPEIEKWREAIGGKVVVAVPYLIGGGGHDREIPDRLGLPPESTSGTVGGVHVAVSTSVGEMDDLARLIVEQVKSYQRHE
ncbi:MAG: hypothetical protein HQ511_02565, partial [Rhodospirillales bacterium]|nr:hypothetical protein [Rhodospirillales bacterium]